MSKDLSRNRVEGEIKVHEKIIMEKARLKKLAENKLDKILEVYEEINPTLAGKYPDQKTRDEVKNLLLEKLDFLDDVWCNQENNPPNIVDEECIVARLKYDSKPNGEHKYTNLVFGNPEKTYKILMLLQ